jgi:hypothetical protein
MFGHDPPMYFRSTTATRCPFAAKFHAASFDPAPLPRITRSYSSGAVFPENCPDDREGDCERFSVLFM